MSSLPAPRLGQNRQLKGFLLATMLLMAIVVVVGSSNALFYPVIHSDGMGYYLYLPAVFIYHEIQMEKVACAFGGTIPIEAQAKTYAATGKRLVKYPLGQAVLMLPFFLVAAGVAVLAQAKLDGFSAPFQYLMALSGCFYALAGVVLLWKVLERHFSRRTVLLAIAGVVYGTNFFHYATFDGIFSHVYSFFLFSALLLAVERIYEDDSRGSILLAAAVAGLIVIIRPLNGLWLLFGLLYGIASPATLKGRLRFWWERRFFFLLALFVFLLVLSPQVVYWKLITGRYFVFSYGHEGFAFANPQIVNVLFSVRKGLFFWAPLLLTFFPGLYYLKRYAPGYLLPAVIYLPAHVYLVSSWWCWWGGGTFGHRFFTEALPLFALKFSALYEAKRSSPFWRRGLTALTVVCILVSTWLMFHYWMGRLPYEGPEWKHVVAAFSSLPRR